MRYYPDFEPSGESFEARMGPPDPISAAIGHIVLNFAALDAQLSMALRCLLEEDESWGQLLTAGLTFAEKLALLDERVHLLASARAFNTGDLDPVALFGELRDLCVQAAQRYAQVLDPTRAADTLARIHGLASRSGRRRRLERRLRVARKEAAALLDIAEFMGMVIEDLREFFALGGLDTA